MLSKIKKLLKTKEQQTPKEASLTPTSENKEGDILFGETSELSYLDKDTLKEFKEVATLNLGKGREYLLYFKKSATDLKKADAKMMIYYFIDAIEQRIFYLIAEDKKNIYFIKPYQKEKEEESEEGKESEEEGHTSSLPLFYTLVSTISKSRFDGKDNEEKEREILPLALDYLGVDNRFNYFTDDFSSLEKLYKKEGDYKLIILLGVVLLLVGSSYIFLDDGDTKKRKPRKPRVAEVTELEKNTLKKILTQKYLKDLQKESLKIAHGGMFENIEVKRIVRSGFQNIKERHPENPYFNKRANKWEYRDETLKRGALSLLASLSFEKSYPDIGYDFSRKIEGVKVYRKNTSITEKVLGIDIDEEKAKEVSGILTSWCINRMIEFPNTTVYKRENERIFIEFKHIPANMALEGLLGVYDRCPVYLKTFTISQGEAKGVLVTYKINEEEDNASK